MKNKIYNILYKLCEKYDLSDLINYKKIVFIPIVYINLVFIYISFFLLMK